MFYVYKKDMLSFLGGVNREHPEETKVSVSVF